MPGMPMKSGVATLGARHPEHASVPHSSPPPSPDSPHISSPNGHTEWVDGKILDPGNGNVYASSIWLIDSDTLKVRGYLGPFYRSQIWKRAN